MDGADVTAGAHPLNKLVSITNTRILFQLRKYHCINKQDCFCISYYFPSHYTKHITISSELMLDHISSFPKCGATATLYIGLQNHHQTTGEVLPQRRCLCLVQTRLYQHRGKSP